MLAFAGCERIPEWLRVERVDPRSRGADAPVLALNQSITVYFDAAIDPLSVTSESFRVADHAGRGVDGTLDIGTRSIRFRPFAPRTQDLDDGSFRPGESYRLELGGMPSSSALRSRAGRPLDRPLAFSFTVARTPAELGLPTLFLPVGIGDEPFAVELDELTAPRIAVDARRFTVRLSLPPLPSSLRPEAFQLWRLLPGAAVPERVAIARVAAVVPDEVRSGSTSTQLEVELPAEAKLRPGDLLYLAFETGDAGLLDYRGRPLEALPAPIPVKVDEGDRARVLDLDLRELRFASIHDDALGFELRDGRIVARARVEAGTGRAGMLRVPASLLVDGDSTWHHPVFGELPASGAGLEFTALDVPAGSELRLRPGSGSLVIRVCGDVRIAGRIVLEGSARDLPWRAGPSPDVDQLARSSGVCLILGGDFVVEASAAIVAEPDASGSPLTVVAGGEARVAGRMPPRVAFALDPAARIRGSVESPIVLLARLTPGLPTGTRLAAAAASAWLPLPVANGDEIDVSLEDPRGALRGELQVAPPDVLRPDQPSVDAERWVAPLRLPLRQPLRVPRGAWFRVLLEAEVDGTEVPSLGGLAVRGG